MSFELDIGVKVIEKLAGLISHKGLRPLAEYSGVNAGMQLPEQALEHLTSVTKAPTKELINNLSQALGNTRYKTPTSRGLFEPPQRIQHTPTYSEDSHTDYLDEALWDAITRRRIDSERVVDNLREAGKLTPEKTLDDYRRMAQGFSLEKSLNG